MERSSGAIRTHLIYRLIEGMSQGGLRCDMEEFDRE